MEFVKHKDYLLKKMYSSIANEYQGSYEHGS